MTARHTFRLTLGIFFAALFIWLITRQINLNDVLSAFVDTNTSWIIAALVIFCVGYACRIERWRLMLSRDNPNLKWSHCAGPLLSGFAVNNVLPFRAGDVLRAFAFNNRLGVSSGIVVATLFVERLLDLLMLIILLGFALVIFGIDTSSAFLIGGSSTLIIITVGILLVLLFPKLFSPFVIFFVTWLSRLFPKIGQKLLDESNKSFETLFHLAKGTTMGRLIAWSLCVWLAEGCVFWFAALALSSITVPEAGWLALSVGTLATLIPSTPGYIGTFDYFTIEAMIAMGNTISASTAYALLVHALMWFPLTLIGGMYLILHPTKNKIKVL